MAGAGLLTVGCGGLPVDLTLIPGWGYPELCVEPGQTETATVQFATLPAGKFLLRFSGLEGPDSSSLSYPDQVAVQDKSFLVPISATAQAKPGSYQITYSLESAGEEASGPAQRTPIGIVIDECE